MAKSKRSARTAPVRPSHASFEKLNTPPTRATATSDAYRADVDGLRAVAVGAVILYHIDKTLLPGGFVGVDMFFVISGFVVSGSLLRQRHETTTELLVAFYSRRVKRLSPALLVTVLTASVAISLLITPTIAVDLGDYYASAAYGIVGWANNHFAARGTAYSDEGPKALEYNPFTHLWSLGVEEQFYFCFPFLVALAYGGKVAGSGPRLPISLSPITILSGTWVLSLAIAAVLTEVKPTWAFYTLPPRFWQLMSGAMLYDQLGSHSAHEPHLLPCGNGDSSNRSSSSGGGDIIARQLARVPITLRLAALELSVIALFIIAFGYTDGEHGFPLPWSLPAIGAAVGTIALGSYKWPEPGPMITRVLASDAASYIGRLSYPLYLWHFPIFVLCKWTLGLSSTTVRLGAIGATTLLAMATYHGIEGAVRSWRPKQKEEAKESKRNWGDMQFWLHHECWNKAGWDFNEEAQARVRRCLTPSRATSTQKALFFIGDSHAGAMEPGMRRAVQGTMAFAFTARGMCGYLSDASLDKGECGQDPAENARAYRDFITSMLKEHVRVGDVVALTAASGIHLRKANLAWYDAFLIPLLKGKGAKLVLIGEPPALKDAPQVCIPSPTNPNADQHCESTYREVYGVQSWDEAPRNTDDSAEAFAKSRDGVFFFRTFGLFCTSTDHHALNGKCGSVVPGTALTAYTDTRHLRRAGAVYLWPFFCAAYEQWGFFAPV